MWLGRGAAVSKDSELFIRVIRLIIITLPTNPIYTARIDHDIIAATDEWTDIQQMVTISHFALHASLCEKKITYSKPNPNNCM